MSGLFQLLGLGARSLSTAQLAQATVGNNAANAATPGFSRRRVTLAEGPTVRLANGVFGTGVTVESVTRLRDALIDAQRRADSHQLQYAKAQSGVLTQVENLLGAGDTGPLATALNGLFAAFGDLAVRPGDAATRQALLGRAQTFATTAVQTHDRLVQLQSDTFQSIGDRVNELNDVASRLAAINAKIAGNSNDPSLADEQDRLVDRLSELIGARATRRSDGTVQVVLEGTGVQLVDGARAVTVAVAGTPTSGTVSLTVSGVTLATAHGEIGGLMDARNSSTDGLPKVLADLDTLVSGVIQAVNRVHASGVGLTMPQTTTGTVTVANPAAMLNAAGLWVTPTSGTLRLGVFDAAGNQVSTSTLAIDPTTMSLNSLAAAINGLPNLSTAVVNGQLTISAANPANRIAFGPDTSGTLVALGINGLFSGTNAGSVTVSSAVSANPNLIAAAQADFTTGVVSAGDNRNARALQALGATKFLNGSTQTASDFLGAMGAAVGTWSQSASAQVDTQSALLAAADAQRQSTSGVNVDEELADMVRYQHAYEASAKYISTVDDMIKTLLAVL